MRLCEYRTKLGMTKVVLRGPWGCITAKSIRAPTLGCPFAMHPILFASHLYIDMSFFINIIVYIYIFISIVMYFYIYTVNHKTFVNCDFLVFFASSQVIPDWSKSCGSLWGRIGNSLPQPPQPPHKKKGTRLNQCEHVWVFVS